MKLPLTLLFILFSIQGISLAQDTGWEKWAQEGKKAYQDGNFESAYELLLKASKEAPADVDLTQYLAQAAYRAGKYKEAAEAYQKLKENENQWADYNQGNAKFKEQDLEGAIESYKEALRKNPKNEAARYNLTKALKQKQKNEQNKQQKQNQQKNQSQQNQNDQDQQKQDQQKQDQQNQQGKENEPQDSQNQRNQGKLSREQTEQLLDALQKADNQAQKKLKEQKPKEGVAGGPQKDW